MIINQKKVAQAILAKRKDAPAVEVKSEVSTDPRHGLAMDLIAAVKSGSAQGVLDALDALDAMADQDDEGEYGPGEYGKGEYEGAGSEG